MDLLFPPWLIWFVLGVGLAFLELLLPGFIVLFLGVGCWVTSGALFIWDLTLTQQITVFIVATIGSIVLLRKLFMRMFRGRTSPCPEDYDDFPKGLHVKVLRPITPETNGRIQYRGAAWDATANESFEEGQTVEILRYADHSRQVFFVGRIRELP